MDAGFGTGKSTYGVALCHEFESVMIRVMNNRFISDYVSRLTNHNTECTAVLGNVNQSVKWDFGDQFVSIIFGVASLVLIELRDNLKISQNQWSEPVANMYIDNSSYDDMFHQKSNFLYRFNVSILVNSSWAKIMTETDTFS